MEVSRKRAESPISPKIGGKIPKLDTNMATENIKNTLVDVGQQFDRWCELMVIIGAITHEAFALDLLNWFERCPKLSAARRKKGILPVEKKEESDNTHNSGDGISCDKSANQSAASQNSSRPEPRSEESYKITLNDSCSSSPVPSSLSPFTSQDATIKETDEKQSKETEKCETGTSQGTFPVMVMAVPGADEAITADPSTTLQYTNQSTPNTESSVSNVPQQEKKVYIQNEQKRSKFRRERKKLLCSKIFDLVTQCGGRAFFQYSDYLDRTWTYATCDAMWERYLTSGICPGNSDNWLDNSGAVLNQITYLKTGSSKWPLKPTALGHNTNGNAFPYVERTNSSVSCGQGDVFVVPEKQSSLPPNNVSSSDDSEIVSSSSTSISLLLPSTALSSVHLSNAEKILGTVSTTSTIGDLPASVCYPASSQVPAATLSTVKQPVTFLPAISQPMMIVPQSHVTSSDRRKSSITVPSAGQTILMPIQGNAKGRVSLLSPMNNAIFMPLSHIEKSRSQQHFAIPITYTNPTGQRKVPFSKKLEKAQVPIAQPVRNSDPQLPVFSLLVPASTSTLTSTSIDGTAPSSKVFIPPTAVAAIPKDKEKTLSSDSLKTPLKSAADSNNSSSPASNPSVSGDREKPVHMDAKIDSSSKKIASTSSNIDSSLTSEVSSDKNHEKPVNTKHETNSTGNVVDGDNEDVNKVVPYTTHNIEHISGPNKQNNLHINSDHCYKTEDTVAKSNDDKNENTGTDFSNQKHKLGVETVVTTAPDKVSDSGESGNEMDNDDDDDDSDDDTSEESDEDEAHCEICGELYNVRRDNKRMGRWIGCEMDCGVWVHRKCVGWTEEMVDTQSYYCDKCQLERLCRLDESL
ncbi:mucin-5AC-like isoform X3 [Gigantopelta aegis]|uniref:mucin-5AC-like isoform X3 n=1 Tax=Gigantopelta aegis TaxID=1735272 RepID=UPI001B88959E|nr:mucin-5AC-like isoform X3 [Gigantopelta aegis]